MKKILFSLILAVLMGIGLSSVSFASQVGNELSPYRTFPLQSGTALHANTLIVSHGGVLRYISGDASSANAVWTIYDASSVAKAIINDGTNKILIEGGQATQYGVIGPIDLGDTGINFSNGLVVVTTTADVTVLYY